MAARAALGRSGWTLTIGKATTPRSPSIWPFRSSRYVGLLAGLIRLAGLCIARRQRA